MAPPRAKITGLYVNSALAKSEAVQNGYDEAILLSHDGHVAEGSAENVFLGPPRRALHARSLAERARRRDAAGDHGHRARRAGLEIVERSIDRGELYTADEIFFTGTAVGVCLRRFGRSPAGRRRRDRADHSALAELYERIVTGREPRTRRG